MRFGFHCAYGFAGSAGKIYVGEITFGDPCWGWLHIKSHEPSSTSFRMFSFLQALSLKTHTLNPSRLTPALSLVLSPGLPPMIPGVGGGFRFFRIVPHNGFVFIVLIASLAQLGRFGLERLPSVIPGWGWLQIKSHEPSSTSFRMFSFLQARSLKTSSCFASL
jgi:hypothetical protein